MLFAQFLPSALSKVATRSLLCYERLLSTRVSNVARVHLERAPVGWRSFRPSVAVVSGCRFRLNFGRMEFGYSFFCNSLFLCNCRVDSRLVTIAHILSCSSVGLPHGGVVGFKDVSSRLVAEAFIKPSVLMKLL